VKKATNWDLYFQKQMGDPRMRSLIEEELKAFRVVVQIAKLRQRKKIALLR
jgi:hypothetical protein